MLVPIFLALLLAGCARKSASERGIWAEVDGKPVFRDQVERVYRSRSTSAPDTADPDQTSSFKLNILNELINNEILLNHASHSRISVSEAEVDTKLAEIQSPYSKEEFQKKLQDQGLGLGDLRREVRRSLIIDKLINKEIASRITVSDAEILQYYERNKANFNVPETEYHLAQIVVTPGASDEIRNLKNDDAKNLPAAERKIQALYARLRSGEDFATVAQAYSEDARTAVGGGDLGFIPSSGLNFNPPLKQVISSLKAGQMSGIIRTPNSFHILKLLGREEAGQKPLSDPRVQSAIRRTLMNEKEQLLKAAYIEALRNKAKVVNFLADEIVTAGGVPARLK